MPGGVAATARPPPLSRLGFIFFDEDGCEALCPRPVSPHVHEGDHNRQRENGFRPVFQCFIHIGYCFMLLLLCS